MTMQLTKAQIDAIKVELRKYGLNVLPMPGKRGKAVAGPQRKDELAAYLARVSAAKFKTAGVKARMVATIKLAMRCRDWHAANPVSIGDVLPMFGVRLGQVAPWPDGSGFEQRWRGLRNGIGKQLALPAPNGSRNGVFGHAATHTVREAA